MQRDTGIYSRDSVRERDEAVERRTMGGDVVVRPLSSYYYFLHSQSRTQPQRKNLVGFHRKTPDDDMSCYLVCLV